MTGKSNSPWGEELKFKETGAAGAEATFTFDGTGVAIVGRCSQEGGRADVFLDGKRVGEVDAWIPKNTHDNDYWHVNGLRAAQAFRPHRGPAGRRRPIIGQEDTDRAGRRLRACFRQRYEP